MAACILSRMDESETKTGPQNIVISPKPLKGVITPYAMAKMSDDLYLSSKNYKPDRFPLINYFLYCASIELALKAAILSLDCSKPQLEKLKSIGHNLDRLVNKYESTVDDNFLKRGEKQILRQVNKYYKDKGLEYFTYVVMDESLRAFKNFPNINTLEKISDKLNQYIANNQYFIDANTSEEPNSGLIVFY